MTVAELEVRVDASHDRGADSLVPDLEAAGLFNSWTNDAEGAVTGFVKPGQLAALGEVLGVIAVTPVYQQA